jgi:hypothetical protein
LQTIALVGARFRAKLPLILVENGHKVVEFATEGDVIQPDPCLKMALASQLRFDGEIIDMASGRGQFASPAKCERAVLGFLYFLCRHCSLFDSSTRRSASC